MQVNQIDTLEQFDRLKTDWERVYAADPQAHFFVSWLWLQGWFKIAPFKWFVLAARPDAASPYVAFLPLNIRLLRLHKFNLIRELRMGGKPLGGYTGFVCLPEYAQEAMSAFAAYLQKQFDWDCFQMEHVLDPRLDMFLEYFSPDRVNVQLISRIRSTCIPLPKTWEQYLQNCLGIKPRQNLKRHTRQIENNHNIQLVHAQEDRLPAQINAAQALNQLRWNSKPEHILNWERSMLQHCFEHNCLWLTTLWDNSTPIAFRAALFDEKKNTVFDFFTGYDSGYAKMSPGTVILGYNIRSAIENGSQKYDFLMGDDEYKFAFGANRQMDAITIKLTRKGTRGTLANGGLKLLRHLRDLRKKTIWLQPNKI
jgi:CelD/BcsL family acetyltransferase involved in cellulose biosynthesis